jgi:hypothetical protein
LQVLGFKFYAEDIRAILFWSFEPNCKVNRTLQY